MMQTVSIIIPSLGSKVNLRRLLESIRIQDFVPESLEVLVVLNGVSSEECEEISANLGPCLFRLVVETLPFRNVNLARNRGVEMARHEVLLFLDDDCALEHRKFLAQHIAAHSRNPLIFAFGGGYTLPERAGYLDRVYNYLQMRWLTLGSVTGAAQFLLGGNFSVKAELLNEKGLRFDEAIAYGGSEFEFFVKAQGFGLLMNSEMPGVLHHTNESFKGLTRKNFLQGRGAAIIDEKYPNRAAVGGKSITDPSQPALSNVLFLYFNYVFWAGYHVHQRKYHHIILRIFGDLLRALNFYRFEVLRKISGRISEKDQT